MPGELLPWVKQTIFVLQKMPGGLPPWDKANNFRAAQNARRTVIASNKANKWSANLKGNVLRQDGRKRQQLGLCGQRNSLGKRGA